MPVVGTASYTETGEYKFVEENQQEIDAILDSIYENGVF